MAKNKDSAKVDFIKQSLEKLREKLLDLSNRNSLLNFKHSERSKTHIRIIDELVNQVYEKLIIENKSLTFKALPAFEDDPKDEKTSVFKNELIIARRFDEEYLRDLEELDENIGSKKNLEIERELRNRVREKLGWDPVPLPKNSIPEYARAHGFNPSYELPQSDEEGNKQHYDNNIQTRLIPEDMERKLRGIRAYHRSAVEEKGINTLYLALGFLEWMESENSDRPFISPLILIQIEIDTKRSRKRGLEFNISSSLEEPIHNITLIERFKRDFGLELPEYNSEKQNPEEYFADISKCIKGKANWSVRRFATIGHFAFQRLVMYNDIRHENWIANPLHSHDVLSQLIGGTEDTTSNSIFAEEYDIDNEDIQREVPVLITDADSSQHSSIIDVLRGKNLSIEGPPGTGKSQTITNLIAAALSKNKKVLFIAEKKAALDVVKNRLDACKIRTRNAKDANIGDFCLELHSTKARKLDVIESLRKRDDIQDKVRNPKNIENDIAELKRSKSFISSYISFLKKKFGNAGFSIRELIWADRRINQQSDKIPLSVKRVKLLNCKNYTQPDLKEKKELLSNLEEYANIITGAFKSVSDHPWSWIQKPELTRFERDDLIEALIKFKEAITPIIPFEENLRSRIGYKGGGAIFEIEEFFDDFKSFPQSKVNTEILTQLKDAENCTEAEQQIKIINDFNNKQKLLSEYLYSPRNAVDTKGIPYIELLNNTPEKYLNISGDWIRTRLEPAYECLDILKNRESELQDFVDSFNLKISDLKLDEFRLIGEAIQMIDDVTFHLLEYRDHTIISTKNYDSIQLILAQFTGVKLHEKEEIERFDLSKDYDSSLLLEYANTIKEAGFFSLFNKTYRQGLKLFKRIYLGNEKLKRDQIAKAFKDLFNYYQHKEKFLSNPLLKIIPKEKFEGWHTNFESIADASQWADKIRKKYDGSKVVGKAIRDTLLNCKISIIEDLRNRVNDTNFTEILSQLSKVEDFIIKSKTYKYDELSNELVYFIKDLTTLQTAYKKLGLKSGIEVNNLNEISDLLNECHELKGKVESSDPLRLVLGNLFDGIDSPIGELVCAVDISTKVGGLKFNEEFYNSLLSDKYLESLTEIKNFDIEFKRLNEQMWKTAEAIKSIANGLPNGDYNYESLQKVSLKHIVRLINRSLEHRELMVDYSNYLREYTSVREAGLEDLLNAYQIEEAPLKDLAMAFDLVYFQNLLEQFSQNNPKLLHLTSLYLNNIRKKFQDLDKEILQSQSQKLGYDLASTYVFPGIGSGPIRKWTGWRLVTHEMSKQKRHIPIRKLLKRAWESITTVKPCFMMSPMTVSQFLEPGNVQFDLLIIDEASQMKPEEAIAAIGRVKQIVVVGDPKQLPPTNFFASSNLSNEEEEDEENYIEMESILDLSMSMFRPSRQLRWHYRSKHASLIAFSNSEFYDNRLVTFPSPYENHPDFGVKLINVNGSYQPKQGVNVKEGKEVSLAAIRLMHEFPNRSIGIATMNQKQRDFIDEEMDQLIGQDEKAHDYVSQWENEVEYFFIKNLENIQGDERDIILISTLYGHDQSGNMYQRFGPINTVYGHRRLNVLFSRAKENVLVYTSLNSADILVSESSSRGVIAFKNYLEYAKTGILSKTEVSDRDPDSDFEIAVCEVLERHNYEAVPQVGVSGYWIDIGVRNPDNREFFILGVETDGATWHSSKSARDRDRLRQETLERQGWNIYRIWSTDWFNNPQKVESNLIRELEKQISIYRKKQNLENKLEAIIKKPDQEIDYIAKYLSSESFQDASDYDNRDRVSRRILKEYIEQESHLLVITLLKSAFSFNGKKLVEQELDIGKLSVKNDILRVEEIYNNWLYMWLKSNGTDNLWSIPWISNLSSAQNCHLRAKGIKVFSDTHIFNIK